MHVSDSTPDIPPSYWSPADIHECAVCGDRHSMIEHFHSGTVPGSIVECPSHCVCHDCGDTFEAVEDRGPFGPPVCPACVIKFSVN